MKRIVVVLVCAMALLGQSVAPVSAPEATAASRVYSPANGAMAFNVPRGPGRGTANQQYAIIKQLNAAIRSTGRGQTIHMAMYLLNVGSTADALIAAHRRGANVRILIDDGERRSDITRLRRALGTNKRSRSFVATCSRGCMSRNKSTQHAKFYLFSKSGYSPYVSMISSANPYRGNTLISWNNMHTITHDKKIYDALYRYFYAMLPDRSRANYVPYRVTSGRNTLFFFPQRSQAARPEWVRALNGVSCTGMARGYGIRGRTRIRVAQWGWTTGRVDIANKLRSLHARGCNVEVILNKGRTNKSVFQALLKPTSRGKVKVYDAWYDGDKDGIASHYNHHKTMTIDGKWFGKSRRIVYTGSQNWSVQAFTDNNDIIFRIDDSYRVHKAYMVNLNLMRDRVARRVWTVPSNPKIPDERGRMVPNTQVEARERYVPGTNPKAPTPDGFLKEGAPLEEFGEG